MTTKTELRHLLEMAARACGYMPNNWQWSQRAGIDGAFRYQLGGDWVEWAPHTDDGDSARMRSALLMDVKMRRNECVCVACVDELRNIAAAARRGRVGSDY